MDVKELRFLPKALHFSPAESFVSFAAERKINLRRLKNHSAENEKSFGADFYDIHYQIVAKNLPNVFFRSGTQG